MKLQWGTSCSMWTERRTDMMNVKLAFGHFARALTKERTLERQADFPISFSLICSKSVQSFVWLSTSRRKTATYILLSGGKRTTRLNRPPSSDNQFPGEWNCINPPQPLAYQIHSIQLTIFNVMLNCNKTFVTWNILSMDSQTQELQN